MNRLIIQIIVHNISHSCCLFCMNRNMTASSYFSGVASQEKMLNETEKEKQDLINENIRVTEESHTLVSRLWIGRKPFIIF